MIQCIQRIVTYLQSNVLYSLLIVSLALLSILMLGYEFLPNAQQDKIILFRNIDLLIAVIFLLDFFLGLIFNTHFSKKEFVRHNWLNLVSSIPVTSDITRLLRILRIFRAFRVVRAGLNFYFAKHRYDINRHN
jgi:type II secretory pathway component PulF